MKQLFSNFSTGKLASAATSIDTSLTLQSGQGTNFPNFGTNEYAIARITNVGPGFEIIKIVGKSGDNLVVERGLEDSLPTSWGLGSNVDIFISAGTLDNFVQKSDQFGHFKSEVFTANLGQSVFELQEGEYDMGQNALNITINGVDQFYFTEVDSKTFSLSPLYRGENVKARYLTKQHNDFTSASSISYFPSGGQPIDLQNYIRSLEDRLAKLENS